MECVTMCGKAREEARLAESRNDEVEEFIESLTSEDLAYFDETGKEVSAEEVSERIEAELSGDLYVLLLRSNNSFLASGVRATSQGEAIEKYLERTSRDGWKRFDIVAVTHNGMSFDEEWLTGSARWLDPVTQVERPATFDFETKFTQGNLKEVLNV